MKKRSAGSRLLEELVLFFEKLLEKIGMVRSDVWIGNIVKH